MARLPEITLAPLSGMTQYAPLMVLGFLLEEIDWLSPMRSRLVFPPKPHTDHPQDAVITLLVSILAGCRSVHQINTRIRPDRLLAAGWGQSCFMEQSTVARVLDSSQREQVEQLRQGIEGMYRWMGQAPHHDWQQPLWIDIDLTALPSSARGQGSTKGYLGAKRGALDANCAGLGRPPTMKASVPCCTLAIRSANKPFSRRCGS